MGKPYSMDLRKRVVAAVASGGMSCNRAAKQFGVGISTAINWVNRLRQTGSVAPGQIGGHKPKKISGAHRLWLLERIKDGDFTLRGLVAELADRGLKVDYRSVWEFVHAEKLSFKKKRGGWRTRPSRRGAAAGAMDKVSRSHRACSAWFSSMRPGPRPIWRRCADGRRAANASSPRSRIAVGRRRPSWPHSASTGSRRPGCWRGRSMARAFGLTSSGYSCPRCAKATSSSWTISAVTRAKLCDELIRSAGAKLFFLPKYSPDLNPIEQVFAKLKHLLRKAAARTAETVCAAIGQILTTYTPEECANYFRNSGYPT